MKNFENLGAKLGVLVNPEHLPTFDELAEDFPDESVPVLDQKNVNLKGSRKISSTGEITGSSSKSGSCRHLCVTTT
jgi:hypothetical protein